MFDRCARCDTEGVLDGLTPPNAWLDYLQEERGLAPPIGIITVPLCHDCEGEAGVVRETWRELGRPSLDTDSGVASDVRDFLDSLDIDAITDDMR